MNTKLLTGEDAAEAGEILKRGGVVAIPTETVYGLAASAFSPEAVSKIFEAKGRPADNPLIVHIAGPAGLAELCRDIPEETYALASAFWPGPLTVIVKKKPIIPDIVNGGLEGVAVRVPAHKVALAVIKAAGVPLAAPSANISGKPSPTEAAHVLSDLSGKIDAVIDGGRCEVGVESTVLDLTVCPFRLLRPGGVTKESIEAVLGRPIEVDGAVWTAVGEGERVASPGMKYRHYAPDAPARAVLGRGEDSARYIKRHMTERDGVICFTGYAGTFAGCALTVEFGGEDDMAGQARGLFSALRRMDQANVERVFIQCPEENGVGLAVANRVKKAAGFDVVRA